MQSLCNPLLDRLNKMNPFYPENPVPKNTKYNR